MGIASLCLMGIASSAWGQVEAKKPSQPEPGLRGILATIVPDGLTEEDFTVLDENWAKWSSTLSLEVAALYEDEKLDAAGQRELLTTLNAKLRIMEKALADERYASLFDGLVSIYGKLKRRVDVAEAALETLGLKPEDLKAPRLAAALDDVAGAVGNLQTEMDKFVNGGAWMKFVRAEEILKFASKAGKPQEVLAVLTAVHKRLQGRHALKNAEVRKFLNNPAFASLEKSIDGYFKANKIEPKPMKLETARAELTSLMAALEDFEVSGANADARRVDNALAAIAGAVPDEGERIFRAVSTHFHGDNVLIFAHEKFLSRMVHEERTDTGPVKDHILGADVTGTQTTTSRVGVDVKPIDDGILFDVTLTGITKSKTKGVVPRATIYSDGHHEFLARKETVFDGHTFTLKPATIKVDANITVTDADTERDGRSFARTATNRAMRIASSRRNETEPIAAQRVESRVLPEFDAAVAKKFKDVNSRLSSGLSRRLRESLIYPDVHSFHSTDTHAVLNSMLRQRGELSGGIPNAVERGEGLLLQLHETVMNNVADRLNFAGRTMTDQEIRHELEEHLAMLLGRSVRLGDAELKDPAERKKPTVLIFANEDAIRFHIDDGALNLVLRTGFQQDEGKEDIPTKEITIPFRFHIDGDHIVIQRGTVRVAAIGQQRRHIAHASVIRKEIQASLGDHKRDRKFLLEQEGKEPLAVSVSKIKALAGWLTIWAE